MTNEMLYLKVLRKLGVTERELLGRCRRQGLVDARCLMAAALMGQPLMNQKGVARILGVSQAAVCHLLKRHEALMEVDEGYRKKWERVTG